MLKIEMTEREKLITIKKVEKITSLSEKTIKEKIKKGEFPKQVKGTKHWKYGDLIDFYLKKENTFKKEER